MVLSVFTYIAKDFKNDEPLYFKEIIFVKCGKKVYIEITCGVDMNDVTDGLDMGIMDIVMHYSELMKHKYLKAYYDLSLKANKICGECDTIYIIEDSLTNAKEAKIGKCCQVFKLNKIKKNRVAPEPNITEFITNYNLKYGFEENDFDKTIATYHGHCDLLVNFDRLRDINEIQINWGALSTNPSIFAIV